MPSFAEWMFVAGGGAIGSTLRYLLAIGSVRWTGGSTLAGTFVANLLGCFAIGLLAAFVTMHPEWLSHRSIVGIRVGLLGGLTTFSTFAAESVLLTTEGRLLWMALYVAASVGFGLVAVWAGMAVVPAAETPG